MVAFFDDEDGAAVSAVAFSVLCPQPIMKEEEYFYLALFVMMILDFKKQITFAAVTTWRECYDCFESQNNQMKQN